MVQDSGTKRAGLQYGGKSLGAVTMIDNISEVYQLATASAVVAGELLPVYLGSFGRETYIHPGNHAALELTNKNYSPRRSLPLSSISSLAPCLAISHCHCT